MTHKLIPFELEHLDLFEWREHEYKMYNIGSDFMSVIGNALDTGHFYTLVKDGRILVIGGLAPLSKKTAYCFTMFSKYAEENMICSAKVTKRMLHNLIEDFGYHRVTTYNFANADQHHKWCEWLGFKEEGVMPMYDDEGNDYIRYGMVRYGS